MFVCGDRFKQTVFVLYRFNIVVVVSSIISKQKRFSCFVLIRKKYVRVFCVVSKTRASCVPSLRNNEFRVNPIASNNGFRVFVVALNKWFSCFLRSLQTTVFVRFHRFGRMIVVRRSLRKKDCRIVL